LSADSSDCNTNASLVLDHQLLHVSVKIVSYYCS